MKERKRSSCLLPCHRQMMSSPYLYQNPIFCKNFLELNRFDSRLDIKISDFQGDNGEPIGKGEFCLRVDCWKQKIICETSTLSSFLSFFKGIKVQIPTVHKFWLLHMKVRFVSMVLWENTGIGALTSIIR